MKKVLRLGSASEELFWVVVCDPSAESANALLEVIENDFEGLYLTILLADDDEEFIEEPNLEKELETLLNIFKNFNFFF